VQFDGTASLMFDPARGVLYVAQFPRISQGATLFALDAASGRELWKIAAKGYPLVDHSKYLNAVELGTSDGALVVFGWESSGKYIETHDAATGRLLAHALVK
jgi:outer membrane protein assembly factor BamB